ncbi:MAG: LamG-like jellyroll fold domain-containing protein [Phycisphaerales bacterium]
MSKKIFILFLSLAAVGNLFAANLIQNPGFETGSMGSFTTCTIDNWTKFGGSGYYHADSGKVRDLRAIKIWMADSNVAQDFTAIAGEIYNVSAYAYAWSGDNFGFRGMNGVVEVRWLDSTKAILSTDIIGYFYGAQTQGNPIDPYDTWKNISGMAVAPTGAAYGRIRLYIENNGGTLGGSVNWDDVVVEQNANPASNPNPANGSTVDTSTATVLSWTNPAPRHTGDVITCDVYLGIDGNMPGTNTKVVSNQAVSSVNVGTLASNQNYYWRVDCYDPDGADPEVKTEGMVWHFTTTNQAPSVDAGTKKTVWKAPASIAVSMDAGVTDDGFPLPSNLTYAWTVDSGPATPAFSPSSTVENPTVTFTVAGTYILRLTADDGEKEAYDTVKIRVYEQGGTGIVAYWKLDETSGSIAYDSSGNGHDGEVIVNGEPGGTPAWTTGQVNGAISLGGSGDYIYCGSGEWADFTEEMSVSVWIKCRFDAAFQSIVTKGDSSWRLFRDSVSGDSNNASFTLTDVGPVASGSTGPVGDDQWHQVVGTFDGVTQCIYVDGVLANSAPVTAGSLIATNVYSVCIGADAEHEGEHEFNGLIDEVRLHEIGLTADMVADQYTADGGRTSCGRNHLAADLNQDCYVTFADFAKFAEDWLGCTDVTNPICN